jgi:hypothetical protein
MRRTIIVVSVPATKARWGPPSLSEGCQTVAVSSQDTANQLLEIFTPYAVQTRVGMVERRGKDATIGGEFKNARS